MFKVEKNCIRLLSSKEKKHALTELSPTVFSRRGILGEPAERNPAFVVDFGHCLCCASEKERTVK